MIDLWGLKIHGYGLMIGLGIWLAWEVALRYGKVKEKIIEQVAIGTIFWGVVGARAYHVIDLWEYYSVDLVKVLYLWNGGLGIWGAIVGGLTYLLYFSWRKGVSFYELSDSIVLGLPLAQAVGRIGNFINKELYGKNGEPLFAWEGGLNILLFGILMCVSGLPRFSRNDGAITGFYLIGYGLIRIILENFRAEEIIWSVNGVPVAVLFGFISILIGIKLLYVRK